MNFLLLFESLLSVVYVKTFAVFLVIMTVIQTRPMSTAASRFNMDEPAAPMTAKKYEIHLQLEQIAVLTYCCDSRQQI